MPVSSSFIKLLEKVEPGLREVLIALLEEIERQRTVTRDEFNDLKEVVKNLGDSLNILTQKVDELSHHLVGLAQRVDQLAEAQRGTEERLNQLTQRVDQLAEAQRRTEERLDAFEKATAENFSRVWSAIDKLAEAQRRTEEELRSLVVEFRGMKRQFGELSDAVGYRLEDRACKALPVLLERDYGVKVVDKLVQEFIFDPKSGNYIEVNIFGKGVRDDESIVIVGEAKSRLSKNKVNEFLRKKVERISKIYDKVFPVLVIYVRSEPDAVEYAKSKGIAVYYSRELE